MNLVFLTNGSSHGARQLQALQVAGIPISAILLERPACTDGHAAVPQRTRFASKWATFRRLLAERRWGKISERLCENLLGRRVAWSLGRLRGPGAAGPPTPESYYRALCEHVRVVENLNAPSTVSLLASLEPDLVVLGGARILRRPVLSVPRIGALNVHPGLLPAYRGVDVIPWAILNGDPVGVTAHFVDGGVDTGDILLTEELRIGPDDTIESLRAKAQELAAALTVRAVVAIREGRARPSPQRRAEGRLYHRMSPAQLRRARRRLKERQRCR